MSGLTKKSVFADRALSTILGVNEGELVSYAQISKGVHKYIKDNDLKNPQRKQTQMSVPQALPASPTSALAIPPQSVPMASSKSCRDCGAEIPAEALFCDLCGIHQ